jgi:3-oxoacyl-[acyl-carrier protein] reductase
MTSLFEGRYSDLAVLRYLSPKAKSSTSHASSRTGFPSLGLYCSSKVAIEGLTGCWAAELGKNGTMVNEVNPGPVESEMLANIPKDIVEGQKMAATLENRVGRWRWRMLWLGWRGGK